MIAARSGCSETDRREYFEPLATKSMHFDFVPFDDTEKLEEKFKSDPNIVAFLFEPI